MIIHVMTDRTGIKVVVLGDTIINCIKGLPNILLHPKYTWEGPQSKVCVWEAPKLLQKI